MYALVLALLAGYRWWHLRGPARLQPVTGPLAAAGLLGLGAAAGLSREQLGLGGGGLLLAIAAVAAVALGYGVALLIPAARRAFPRYPHPVRRALIGIPLATVAVEEAAFRGLLWGLIERDHGSGWAIAVTAVLFGLWHVGRTGDVLFTAAAGVLLGLLRDAGGGLLAPIALHWAANGLGVLASALVHRRENGGTTHKPDVA